MSKKVGILTFHFGYNYGGVLQSYALQETVKNLGYDVQIINCIPKNPLWFLIGLIRNFSWKRLYDTVRYGYKCVAGFKRFQKQYLDCTTVVHEQNLHIIANQFDTIIVGSDQVWNPSQHDKKIYFLNWQPEFQGIRIAYAPCCGIKRYAETNTEVLRKSLQNFNYLSVRNEETRAFVQQISRIDAIKVPDPTLLYDFDKFVTNKHNTPYILAYILGNDIDGGNQSAIEFIKSIYKDIPVIAIVLAISNPVDCSWADKIRYNVTPQEWVDLIANAAFVYTDSFHGTLFAIKYQRSFIAYYSSKIRASRFIDLKDTYNLDNHIVSSLQKMKAKDITQPPFGNEEILTEQKAIGISFLKKVLINPEYF
ncbi:MAG: polysaccharide pyruvyl transferase family protein [Candidatus Symbiothrix sp.]|jgi:hypothetical protein|nr:polysaccharide pyruvyl transferase family protein [Candidatus Symbiothrix sp.]